MALSGAMSTGISGLKAHMDALSVVGNNVANVNTYGYKAGRVTFKESIYSTIAAGSAGTPNVGGTNPQQIGYGTSIGTIDLDMSTGSLESTGRALDCMINGDGFFMVGGKNPTYPVDPESLQLTRVGDLKVDANGYLTDGAGNIVYGFVTCNANVDANGDPTDIKSTNAGTNGNATSTQLVPIRLPLAAKGTENVTPPLQAGTAIYPGVTGVDADGNLVDADLTTNEGKNNYLLPNAAAELDDTYECISYTGLSIDKTGKITCTNGKTEEPVTVGYIAIATFTNPAGLTKTDGPYYQVGGGSAGAMTINTAGGVLDNQYLNNRTADPDDAANTPPESELLGKGSDIMSSFLEGSTTDLATEFANMIVYQKGYQANTRIVTVTDTMLEELINMKR